MHFRIGLVTLILKDVTNDCIVFALRFPVQRQKNQKGGCSANEH